MKTFTAGKPPTLEAFAGALFRQGWSGWMGAFQVLLFCMPWLVSAAAAGAEPVRCVLIEVYYRRSDKEGAQAVAAAENIKAARSGITVMLRAVDEDARNRERWDAVLKHFKIAPGTSPIIYGCNRTIASVSASNGWRTQLEELLQLEVFTRLGCPHCAAAKQWLPTLMRQYPGLELVYHDISTEEASRVRLSNLVQQYRTAAASVPVFHVCNGLVVGFDSPETTGERLRAQLRRWTHDCGSHALNTRALRNVRPVLWQADAPSDPNLPPDLPLELPIGGADDDLSESASGPSATVDGDAEDEVRVPVLGRLSASKLGMPLFTIAIGLVDGFNPCAMWVLLFLLSILVNLGDRRKILAIAGVFVVVSGLAYFAFMAAWLNVFLLVGYLRPMEIALGLLAIVVGTVHVKDFIAFKKGPSLSIPDSAKPGIYARVRQIVTAEHLTGAVLGAITLAILVNMIELLCTAGLPALYTNILTLHGYSPAKRYAYLSLYILAYMFDDLLMLGAVVITLSKRKLQEREGRWLKLVSGMAILLLGVVMLLKPEWLH